MVATAVGGPLGGVLGSIASRALAEGEYEYEGEYEGEFEFEGEGEYEGEYEGEGMAGSTQAMAELMAAVASTARTQAEAEAMAGAATLNALSARDRAELRKILPNLVRGTAILTRVLRRRRSTRPAIRTVPTIVRRTARTLRQRAASGRRVTRRDAARVMAAQTRNVLSRPHNCAQVLQRNARVARTAQSGGGARRQSSNGNRPPRQRQRSRTGASTLG